MANINAGTVELESGTYEVILRKVNSNVNNNSYSVAKTNNSDNDNSVKTVKPKNKMEGGKRKTRKANKTMEGGKRKLSGYMKFGKARRPEIISAHPEWKGDVVAVAKEIGKQWRALSDAERAKY